MIRSMTGFGKAESVHNDKKIVVEIRSLNSKQLDLTVKLAANYRQAEQNIRQLASETIVRGKAEIVVIISSTANNAPQLYDTKAIQAYIEQLKLLAGQTGHPLPDNIYSLVFKFPGVFATEEEEVNDELNHAITATLKNALTSFDAYRLREGEALQKDLVLRTKLIDSLISAIEPLEDARKETIKQRILKNLQEISEPNTIDNNRFEQELIYYLERLDLTEEKVRLREHCRYFAEILSEEQSGRKLAFVSQEMGREINTIGSKANDAAIQRFVVMMKDELEKIKEQLFNIL